MTFQVFYIVSNLRFDNILRQAVLIFKKFAILPFVLYDNNVWWAVLYH